MTSRTLSSKLAFIKNFMQQNLWLFVMNLFALAVVTTIPLIFQLADGGVTPATMKAIFSENPFVLFVSCITAVATANGLFKYLNTKSEVDFYHSLPVKKQELFWTRYATGVIHYVVALVLNLVVPALVVSVVCNVTPGLSMSFFASALVRYLSVYSFCVFATVITGNTFMSICTALGLMNIFFALFGVYELLCTMFLEFYVSGDTLYQVLYWTNPLGDVFGIAGMMELAVLPCLIQGLVMTALAYICFMKRPSEHSGNPVAVSVFKPIMKSLAVLVGGTFVGLLFNMNGQPDWAKVLLGTFIIGLMIHMVFEMLFELDVRSVFKNLWQFVIMYGMIAVAVMAVAFDVVGHDQRMHPLDEIASITISGNRLTEARNLEILYSAIERGVYDLESVDEDQVGIYSLDRWESGDYYENSYFVGEMTITLKNGQSYARNYMQAVTGQEWLEIVSSREYVIQSHNYDWDEMDLMVAEVKTQNRLNGVELALHTGMKKLDVDQFRQVYELIVEQSDLLTPEYLDENLAVVSLRVMDPDSNALVAIPIYSVQTKALELLDLSASRTIDYAVEGYSLSGGYTTDESMGYVHVKDKPALEEMLLAEMTPVYGYTTRYGNYKISDSYGKLVLCSSDVGPVGYMTVETFDEIIARYEESLKGA